MCECANIWHTHWNIFIKAARVAQASVCCHGAVRSLAHICNLFDISDDSRLVDKSAGVLPSVTRNARMKPPNNQRDLLSDFRVARWCGRFVGGCFAQTHIFICVKQAVCAYTCSCLLRAFAAFGVDKHSLRKTQHYPSIVGVLSCPPVELGGRVRAQHSERPALLYAQLIGVV